VDSSEGRRNEVISLKQVLKLIKKPVWAVSDEVLEVLDIQKVQETGAASNTVHLPDNFPSCIPENKNMVKSSQGNAEIIEDCWL
jgi:hypothetical protein